VPVTNEINQPLMALYKRNRHCQQKRRETPLSPAGTADLPFNHRNIVAFQNHPDFVVESMPSVMFALIFDIANCAGYLRNTDGKSSIANLPTERFSKGSLVHPFGRPGLD